MNRLAIAVKALTFVMLLSVVACSGSDEKANSAADSLQSNAKQAEAFTVSTNIRYIDLDSAMANYNLAVEISTAGQQAVNSLQQIQRQKESELQTLGNNIQQKAQSNGYLTQESYEADMRNFQNRQAQAQNYLMGEQQKVEQAMAQRQRQLQDSIHNFLVDYNASHHYDAILYKDAGVYFNPALDITKEVIEGLNDRYKLPSAADALKVDAKK